MKMFNPAVKIFFLLPAVFASLFFSSCNKGTPARPQLRTNLPVIDSISTKSGPFGTEVTIYGKNLGNTETVITVNGKKANNKAPSDTKFVFTVADSSSTGPIAVKNAFGQTTGPVFTYVPTTGYVVSVFAGDGRAAFADGTGAKASFNSPGGITIDASNNLYVADVINNRIRKITTPGAVVTTFAGDGKGAFLNSNTATLAQFNHPVGVALDQQGSVYVTDEFNHCIRKITAAGVVTTYAGTPGTNGSGNGAAASAQFFFPEGIFIDSKSNFYISEVGISRIRLINPNLIVSNFSGTNVSSGNSDGAFDKAQYNSPRCLALDPSGANLYVCDYNNNKVRRISVPGAIASSPLGSGTAVLTDGTGTGAEFFAPTGLAFGADGNFLVADYGNNRIRKVVTASLKVTTIAGNSSTVFADGTGDKATFSNPYGIVGDTQGNFYVTDLTNNRIRKMTPYTH